MSNYLLIDSVSYLILSDGGRIIIDATAQFFKINDTTITHVTQANWIDKVTPQSLAGDSPLASSRTHTWTSEAMPESIFDLLSAQEGQPVRLTTTKYDDRNVENFVDYPGAILLSLTANHPGPIMAGVNAVFLVRI